MKSCCCDFKGVATNISRRYNLTENSLLIHTPTPTHTYDIYTYIHIILYIHMVYYVQQIKRGKEIERDQEGT